VDLTIPSQGVTRAYSMASPPSGGTRLEFIMKLYPGGAFSALLDNGLKPGDAIIAKGPYGTCFRREARTGPLILIGGGSGMSPLMSILRDHVASGEQRPIRFFYGARTRSDLFLLEKFTELATSLPNFEFIPALSHAGETDSWMGQTGFIHQVVADRLREERFEGEMDAYSCGPPPMIDAVLPVLQMAGVEPERIYFDKFTPATKS
jgi:propane monooxygenase reductase subunit